jgi:hypothetical protein
MPKVNNPPLLAWKNQLRGPPLIFLSSSVRCFVIVFRQPKNSSGQIDPPSDNCFGLATLILPKALPFQ